MLGRRRTVVAVLAAVAAVLATGQASSGVETTTSNPAHSALAPPPDFPVSVGQTVRTSEGNAAGGGTQPQISADGRWQVFTSTADLDPSAPATSTQQVFARDLRTGAITQLSVGTGAAAPDGVSMQPNVSDDGRYVSFVTQATNIVSVPGGTYNALVVCDRDPTGARDATTGDPVLDQRTPAGVLTNACQLEYAGGTAQRVVDTERPALSGDGSRVAWVRLTASGSELRQVIVSDSSGLVAPSPAGGAAVAVDLPAPAPTIGNYLDPVLDRFGINVAFVARTTTGADLVLKVSVGALTPATTRLDGGVAAGDPSRIQRFGSVSISEFGTQVGFRRTSIVIPGPTFRRPVAAALAPLPEDRYYVVTTSGTTVTSTQLVSNDNADNPVAAADGALSRDGRYVAFVTSAPDAFDGTAVGAPELVVRDLTLDGALAQRIPGALVTALPNSACAAFPGANCPSAAGTISGISFDGSGARVSFADDASDLVAGDTGATDTFVRSWQPQLAAAPLDSTDFGDVQAGDNKVLNVPVTVSGFGPVFVNGARVAGPQFAVAASTCTNLFTPLHDGSTCSVAVRFQPAAVGPATDTLSLTSDQYPDPQPVRELTGTGVTAGPRSAAGDSARVSVGPDGGQAPTGADQSMVSGNGRWDVFVSGDNLTNRPISPDGGAGGVRNVFVRDLADPQNTVQISLHANIPASPDQPSRPAAAPAFPRGANPDSDSYSPSISSDGRFVSFITDAGDVVPVRPGGNNDTGSILSTVVVCDRDPTGTKDARGNLVLDLPRPGTTVPDYVCYPIESGSFLDGGLDADLGVLPRLSGNGTRITWVETDDGSLGSRRVRVATLSDPGGALHAASAFRYVPSSIAGFEHDTVRNPDDPFVEQTEPVLTEDGNTVVYWARQHNDGGVDRDALIEATLPATIADSQDTRLDVVPGFPDQFVGDSGTGSFTLDPPAVSDDGNRVAFAYFASPPDESPARTLVYVVTRAGAALSSEIASLDNSGAFASGDQPALSGDGRYLAFRAGQPNMHNGVDPPGGSCFLDTSVPVYCQIVARDLLRDQQRRDANRPAVDSEIVSTSIATTCSSSLPPGRVCAADAGSRNPSIDATGSEVGFDTPADDVVAGDTNEVPESEGPGFVPATDAFVHTWRPAVLAPVMDFGAVPLGASRSHTFEIRLQDFGPVSFGASAITGTDQGDFTLVGTTCPNRTLHDFTDPTERCRVRIRFTPSAPGDRTATLSGRVAKNGYPRHDPGNTISYDPALIRTLTGIGATPVAQADPSPLDFGTRLPEDPVTRTVTITNTGSAPLVVSGVTVADSTHPGAHGDYTVDASGCLGSTPPGGSCVIAVTFTGHRVGVRDAVLVIADNTSVGSTQVGVRARVRKPTVEANPGVSPVRRVITVSGTGFAPNHDVEIGFDKNPQLTATTEADGSFTAQLVVLPNGPQGPRTLFAHSVGFSPTITGEGPFLVVLGSLDNPRLVIRD